MHDDTKYCAAATGERGLRFVDARDVTRAEFPAENVGSNSFTKELEILRGDLAQILYDRFASYERRMRPYVARAQKLPRPTLSSSLTTQTQSGSAERRGW